MARTPRIAPSLVWFASSGAWLALTLVLLLAACATPHLVPDMASTSNDAGRIRVTNLGTRTARISAVSAGAEMALGTVAPGETEEFLVAPSALGSFRLMAGPLVPMPGVGRHASEGISVPWGWDVEWELRASPDLGFGEGHGRLVSSWFVTFGRPHMGGRWTMR